MFIGVVFFLIVAVIVTVAAISLYLALDAITRLSKTARLKLGAIIALLLALLEF